MNCGWAAARDCPVPFANTEPYTNSFKLAAAPKEFRLAAVNEVTCIWVAGAPPAATTGATTTTALTVTPVSVFIITTVSLRLITPIVWIGVLWPPPVTGDTEAVEGIDIIPSENRYNYLVQLLDLALEL